MLELVPNHLSAKYLSDIVKGSAAKELTLVGSEYYTMHILSHYKDLFWKGGAVGGVTLPPHLTESMQKQLGALRPIICKEMKPLFVDVSLLVVQAQNVADGRGDLASLRSRVLSIESRLAQVSMDREVMEKLIRQGY